MLCCILVYIWVNYNISLTWIKAIWGWFPLLTMIPGLGRSEVVTIYPYIYLQSQAMMAGMPLLTLFNHSYTIIGCRYIYIYGYVWLWIFVQPLVYWDGNFIRENQRRIFMDFEAMELMTPDGNGDVIGYMIDYIILKGIMGHIFCGWTMM